MTSNNNVDWTRDNERLSTCTGTTDNEPSYLVSSHYPATERETDELLRYYAMLKGNKAKGKGKGKGKGKSYGKGHYPEEGYYSASQGPWPRSAGPDRADWTGARAIAQRPPEAEVFDDREDIRDTPEEAAAPFKVSSSSDVRTVAGAIANMARR